MRPTFAVVGSATGAFMRPTFAVVGLATGAFMRPTIAVVGLATGAFMRQLWRCVLLVSFALIFSGCVSAQYPKTPKHGGPAWEEIQSDHFVMITNLEHDMALEMVRDLEESYYVMTRVGFHRPPPAGPRARVLALRNAEFLHYSHRSVAGVFVSGGWPEPVMITRTSPGGGLSKDRVFKHELAHYLSSLYVPIHHQPRWYAEGVAEYLETIVYDSREQVAQVGRAPPSLWYVKSNELVGMDELWEWQSGTQTLYYGSSWVTVHYLLNERPKEFAAFEQALSAGEDAREAWQRIFPDLDVEGHRETIGRYLKFEKFAAEETNLAIPEVSTSRRLLSEAEVLAMRASLYQVFAGHSDREASRNRELARRQLKQAFAEDPHSFWPHLMQTFYFEEHPDAATAKQVVEDHDDNWLAWLWYDHVLARSNGALEERREALSHAARIAPNNQRVKRAMRSVQAPARARARARAQEQASTDAQASTQAEVPGVVGSLQSRALAQQVTDGAESSELKALKANVCPLPVGTKELSSVQPCDTDKVFYADRINVTPRNSQEHGFPGIRGRTEWLAVEFEGEFNVSSAGPYVFRLLSDDGSLLYIDGELLIDNDGAHPVQSKSAEVHLDAGSHHLRLRYFQGARVGLALQLFVSPPGGAEQLWQPEL